MKIIVALLLGLLLVARIRSQECRRETHKTWYFVYNATVKIKAYCCSADDAFQCERFHGGRRTEDQNIYKWCRRKYRSLSGNGATKVACEWPTYVNLLNNTIMIDNNDADYCCEGDNNSCILWSSKDYCEDLIQINLNNFDVWTIAKNKMKFIRSDGISLLLTEKTRLCGTDVWRTNHEDIIVSTNYIKNIKNAVMKSFRPIEDNLPKTCETTTKNSRMWYIYEHLANITVYYCVINSTKSCTEIGSSETDSEQHSDLIHRCNNIICGSSTCNSNVSVCKKIHKINFDTNVVTIRGLSQNCTYSSEVCRAHRAFWIPHDICRSVREADVGYEEQGVSYEKQMKFIRTKSSTWTLIRQGKLCGENIWYTYNESLVASESRLQFSSSPPKEKVIKKATFASSNTSLKKNYPGGSEIPEEKAKYSKSESHESPISSNQDSPSVTENTFHPLHSNTTPNRNRTNQELLQKISLLNDKIKELQILLPFAMFLILLCVLWYIFNVIVNFVSLKKLNKTRTSKKRSHLFNCVSQSLTTRCTFLEERETKESGGNVSGIPAPHLSVTVDNELYSRPE